MLKIQILLLLLQILTTAHAPAAEQCKSLLSEGSEVPAAEVLLSIENRILVSPGVYQIENDLTDPRELEVLGDFAQAFGGSTLAISNYRGLYGVPAVDAIHFPLDGPAVNLSIKTSTVERGNVARYIFKKISQAEESIKKNYSPQSIAFQYGYNLVDGRFIPVHSALRNSRPLAQVEILTSLFQVLGLQVQPARSRKIAVVIHLPLVTGELLSIWKGRDVPGGRYAESPEDDFLFVGETPFMELTRVELAQNPFLLNLSELKRRLHSSDPVTAYYVFLNDAVLEITKNDFRFIPRG